MAIQLLLKFDTKRVHGLTRGGEDLFLVVDAFASGGFKPDVENTLLSCYKRGERSSELIMAFEWAWEIALTTIPFVKEENGEDYVEEDGEQFSLNEVELETGLYVKDGKLRSSGSDYGFEIEWDLEAAKRKVYEAIIGVSELENEWVYSLKTKQFQIHAEIFVDGNAE